MIAIVSSNARERAAFAELCNSRGRSSVECDSLRSLRHLLHDTPITIIVTRHRLADAFSDDLLSALVAASRLSETRVIVLLPAGSSALQEARQIELGAATVLRDPIRTEVLVAYIDRYWVEATARHAVPRAAATPGGFEFADALVRPIDRSVTRRGRTIRVTPRELALIKFLFEARGEVVTYHTLYTQMLGRRFRGDSGTLRVLLAKLVVSFASLRIALRRHVEVIAKTGYRYRGQ